VHIRSNAGSAREYTFEYSSVEVNNELPEGSVAKHLEAAAADASFEVVRKGAMRASLRRKSEIFIA
jgi:hypothetical protein